jgi:hypothetical protein
MLEQWVPFTGELMLEEVKPLGAMKTKAIDLEIDTTFTRIAAKLGSRYHEILIGVASNSNGDCLKLSVSIGAVDKPSIMIKQSISALRHDDLTEVTSFTNGSLVRRGHLK